MEEEKKTKFTIECASCEHLIEKDLTRCKGMPLEIDRCIKYSERKKSE